MADYLYPQLSVTATNPSVSANGTTAPLSSTLVGGINPSGNLEPLQTDASGNLFVSVTASALAAGAATAALQTAGNAQLVTIASNQTNGTQVTSINSSALPTGASTSGLQTSGNASLTTIATNSGTQATAALQTSGNASLTTIATNSGTQATAALQTTGNTSLASIVVAGADLYVVGAGPATAVINSNLLLAVTGTAATDLLGYRSISFQVVTGASTTTSAVDFEASDDNVNFVAIGMYDKTTPTAAPVTTFTTAASTSRYFEGPVQFRYFRVRLVAAITAGTIQAFSKASPASYIMTNNSLAAGTQAVGSMTVASGTITAVTAITNALPTGTNNIGLVGTGGSTGVSNAPVQNIYSTTNVTTAAYVQLIASTTTATNYVDIFDSSGQAMILATGASGSEVILAYVPPGGDQIRVQIPISTRIAIKALTATANSGYILLNMWK